MIKQTPSATPRDPEREQRSKIRLEEGREADSVDPAACGGEQPPSWLLELEECQSWKVPEASSGRLGK